MCSAPPREGPSPQGKVVMQWNNSGIPVESGREILLAFATGLIYYLSAEPAERVHRSPQVTYYMKVTEATRGMCIPVPFIIPTTHTPFVLCNVCVSLRPTCALCLQAETAQVIHQRQFVSPKPGGPKAIVPISITRPAQRKGNLVGISGE